jgi:hypothetical protein
MSARRVLACRSEFWPRRAAHRLRLMRGGGPQSGTIGWADTEYGANRRKIRQRVQLTTVQRKR